MTITDPFERAILGSGLVALGCAFLALGAVLTATASGHMTAAAALCGPGAEHCLACAAALVCLAVALAAGGSGLSLLRPYRPGIAAA